mmetsp:Transcript_18722/g.43338  ORF Transcript_18722/g.43338 Transcript_18722/m.43338 type:complete len:471 (+) Transcript_18722:1537-2949(+)|eukprot:CAMPEP_0197194658 /NCGR_PEP_ID=MMETSP1423-20130617/29650_1 /TAXON_ID=476441 /ORGANISM="Pseudo-nitzschia heimii, Strain UNC1101" /LENGTH=470 /DNA_ID=CAMNT_0042648115 /DNA_START=652 /DNA_END=2064 /DNA_ORIENTATION=-
MAEGLPSTMQDSFVTKGATLKKIQKGLAFESKCLEEISSLFTEKENDSNNARVLLDTTNVIESKSRWNHGKKNIHNRSQWRSNNDVSKKVAENTCGSSNKENVTAISEEEKLLIRLPFVNWEATFIKVRNDLRTNQACSDCTGRGETIENGEIQWVVSKIVNGWLLVLAQLQGSKPSTSCTNKPETDECTKNISNLWASEGIKTRSDTSERGSSNSGSPASVPFTSVAFSLAASYRSQIYRRLLLLLLGFISSAIPSQVRRTHHSSIEQVKTLAAVSSKASKKILQHTRELACKILEEEGSIMKKHNTTLVDLAITDGTFFHPSFSYRLKAIKADNDSSYSWFTAIAVECNENLDDLDTASLVYKSIRAIQDRERQQQHDAGYSGNKKGVPRIYAQRDGILEGTKKTLAEGSVLEERIPLKSLDVCGSPQMNITRTPANTPNAVARKKHAEGDSVSNLRFGTMIHKHNYA